jgi:hypothetical protein
MFTIDSADRINGAARECAALSCPLLSPQLFIQAFAERLKSEPDWTEGEVEQFKTTTLSVCAKMWGRPPLTSR